MCALCLLGSLEVSTVLDGGKEVHESHYSPANHLKCPEGEIGTA